MEPTLDRKILEELIYERVRLAVDLCELVTFEEDLAVSIERALARCGGSAGERADLSQRFLAAAWERLGQEVAGELAPLRRPRAGPTRGSGGAPPGRARPA